MDGWMNPVWMNIHLCHVTRRRAWNCQRRQLEQFCVTKNIRLHSMFQIPAPSVHHFLLHSASMFQVQNLEKAGILNKTKVCENGKKVR